MTRKKSNAAPDSDKVVPDALAQPVQTKSIESGGSPASSSTFTGTPAPPRSSNKLVIEKARQSERLAALAASSPAVPVTPMEKLVAVTPYPSGLNNCPPVNSCPPETGSSAAGTPPPTTVLPPVANFVGKDSAPSTDNLQESNVAVASANFVLNDDVVTKVASATTGSAAPHGDKVDNVVSWVNVVENSRKPSHEVIKLKHDRVGISADCLDLSKDTIDEDAMQSHSLIGIFPTKFPGRDAVQKLVESWPRKCKFHFHSSGWIVFTFDKIEDLDVVLQDGPYYVFGKPLILRKMPRFFNFSKVACSVVPLWVQLRNLPLDLWHEKYLNKICSYVGAPQYTDKLTATRERISFARCLVEVDILVEKPTQLLIKLPDGSEFIQHILYEDVPKCCTKCSRLGHTEDVCDGSKVEKPELYVSKKKQQSNKANASSGKGNLNKPAADKSAPPATAPSQTHRPPPGSAAATVSTSKEAPNGGPSSGFSLQDVVITKGKKRGKNKNNNVAATGSLPPGRLK